MTTELNPPLDLTVLMYHYVRDPGDTAEAGTRIPGLSRPVFEAQLDELVRHFNLVTWPALRSRLLAGQPLPANAALLTFDDSVRDHYLNVFPALNSRGLSGLFFAIARQPGDGHPLPLKLHFLLAVLGVDGLRAALWPRLSAAQQARYLASEKTYGQRWPGQPVNILKGCLQRDLCPEVNGLLSELYAAHVGDEQAEAERYYLTTAQVREMAAGGMHFGGHSRSHPWFDFIDSAARAEEIAASARWLSNVEPGPWAFGYPYGGLHPEAPAQLEAHGFAAAFTTRDQRLHTDRYYIGRYDGEDGLPLPSAAAEANRHA
jgi:peptidoglycan/xylan/chitin deacetylase (PgdA/CDA1 family)